MNSKRQRIFNNIARARKGEKLWSDSKWSWISSDDPKAYLKFEFIPKINSIKSIIRNKYKYGSKFNYNDVKRTDNNVRNENNVKKKKIESIYVVRKDDFGGIFNKKAYDSISDDVILKRLIRQGGPIREERATRRSIFEKNFFEKGYLYQYYKYLDNVNDYKYDREKEIWDKYKFYQNKENRIKRARELRREALNRERERNRRKNEEFAKENKRRALIKRMTDEMNKAKLNNNEYI